MQNVSVPLEVYMKKVLCQRIVSEYPNSYLKERIYFIGNEPVAYEKYDDKLNLLKKTGRIPDGKVFQYDKKGKLNGWAIFKDEKYNKMRIWNYPNGSLSNRLRYKEGMKHGLTEYYGRDGKLRMTIRYRNGKMDGPWKFYNENGRLIKVIQYVKGKMQVKEK